MCKTKKNNIISKSPGKKANILWLWVFSTLICGVCLLTVHPQPPQWQACQKLKQPALKGALLFNMSWKKRVFEDRLLFFVGLGEEARSLAIRAVLTEVHEWVEAKRWWWWGAGASGGVGEAKQTGSLRLLGLEQGRSVKGHTDCAVSLLRSCARSKWQQLGLRLLLDHTAQHGDGDRHVYVVSQHSDRCLWGP